MTLEQPASEFFTAGGTLPPDAPSYVKRPTDDELFLHLMAGEFCYVLTPRQMGKSSLMIRTVRRLSNEGVKSAIVDLTQIGTVQSEDQWYKGVLTQIKRRLKLNIDPVSWWEQRKDIPNIQKFIEFLEEMLSERNEHVVIFMDEIDTTLKLDFRDNFFAGIRAIFNARAENRDLKRITFVLLGVASPSDLIKDRNRTPFNIGQEIPLRPFNREDARKLEMGLEEVYPKSGRKILDRIFYWTNGHPYLTQKICQSIVENNLSKYENYEIDELVERLFITEEASRETNLQFVRDNILSYPERRVILSLYKKLLHGSVLRDNKNSLPQNHLKLSGLARVEDGKLVVSNKIYSKVFDQRWVNKYTEIDWRYFIIGALSLIVLGFASVFYNDGIRLPNLAATRVNGVPIYRDDRGIQYLADLFRMQPYIFLNEYEYKAKDTFFNSFSSWEEQKTLIEIAPYEPHPKPDEYKIVVAGLYTSLADVDNSGQTTRLLEVMFISLKEMGMQNEVIYQEIGYWLEARKSANENNFEDALDNYTNAIELNPQNPATLFERARIYTQLENYQNALKDYEQVIAIVPKSIEPTDMPTSIPSSGPGVSTTTASAITPPAASTSLQTVSTTSTHVTQLVTPSTVTQSGSILTAIPTTFTPTFPIGLSKTLIPTITLTPTMTPTLPPIQPRFLTLGQRIGAVRNAITQNENLISFLSRVNPSDYPDLNERGLIFATQAPAATDLASTGACPAITMADMQGVAAGARPQQYEVTEFEAAANCTMNFTGRDEYDQRLVEYGFLPEGDLPPLEERLPEEPLVVVPYNEIGHYGGRMSGVSVAPEAGNSEWLSVRHVNLLRFADDLQTIVPNMAKSFEWNDDYTELTVTLRRGHKWSDGQPFTTDDIVFWWEDIIMNKDLYPEVPAFWVYGGEPMQVEALDDVTVVFKFAVPAPAFTIQLATIYTHEWAPKHFLMDKLPKYNPQADEEAKAEGFDSWAARFIPLYYSDWEDANHQYGLPKLEAWIKVDETPEHQLFVPNPYYYKVDTAGQQLPYIDEVEEVYAAENELFELKIINGEIQYKAQSLQIGSLPLFQENQDKGNYDIQMAQGASIGRTYVFNATHKDPVLAELFSDPRWNRAMSLALNRDEINQALCFGLCEPTQGAPVHPSVSFAKPEWYTKDIEYDPDTANALLDEIGLEKGPDGFRLQPDGKPLVIHLNYAIQFGDPALHELAKEYWEAVGVKVELKEMSTEAFRAMAANNDHDIQVTTSGTVAEAPLYSNPFRLFPPFGDAALEPLFGAPWAEWHATNGAQGTEPPDDIKPLWDLTDQWKLSLPGTDEYISLGQELVQVQMDRGMIIGTTTSPPIVTIVSRQLGNVPQLTINAFEYYRTYPYRTDQWFFK